MIAEKTIALLGHDVKMRYCAATETGYEQLTGKIVAEVFNPRPAGTAEDGTPLFNPPLANTDDYISLGMSAIVAAYARVDEQPPITSEAIIYEASPKEITAIMTAVMELRAKWYDVPATIPENEMKTDEGDEKPKNA